MKRLFILLLIFTPLSAISQNKTEISMFLKRDAKTPRLLFMVDIFCKWT